MTATVTSPGTPAKQSVVSGLLGDARETATSFVLETRVFELFLGLALPFWRAVAIPGIPNEIIIFTGLIALGAFIRPTRYIRHLQWIMLAYGLMLVHVIIVSMIHGQPWLQRSFRMALLFGFLVMLAEGRFHWKSMLTGMVISMVFINAPAYYLGLTADYYPPYLTGFVGDKNVVGMYYALLAVGGLCLYQKAWQRVVHFLAVGGLLWLTGSRTAIMAAVLGAAWYLVRTRTGVWVRLVLVGATIQFLIWFEDRFARVGVFEDRHGTDWLRGQIDSAAAAMIENTAWYGRGLNTAWVSLPNFPHMSFHDSYGVMRIEGGYPMMAVMLGIIVLAGMGLLSAKRNLTHSELALSGALVVTLVCAWKLGEVFFTAPVFFMLAGALHERLGEPFDPSRTHHASV